MPGDAPARARSLAGTGASAAALGRYLAGREVAGVLVAYHGAGGTFLPDAPKYATANAASCADGASFKAAVQARYPAYSGENYLDMTAGYFFG